MLLMMSLNIISLAQTFSVSGKILYLNETEAQPLAFATIKVYSSAGDSLHLMKGCVSTSSGNWAVEELESGNYQIEVTYVGMKKERRALQLNQNVRNLDFTLHEENELLEAVEVSSKRKNRHMDKTVYTFSDEDVKKSMDARDLLANIPNLYLNTMNHQLSALDGKSMLVLVNGVPSDDIDLRLLSPHIVKNVEYYDVPPLKYASSAQIVINVHLKPNDNGWNFSNDASVGKIFERIVPAYSYIKNKHKFTISATSFINPKYETTNIENGIYEYKLGENNYKYEYEANKSDWGNQNKLQLKYLNAQENDYTMCINASVSYNDIRNKEERDICLAVDDELDYTQGGIQNKVFTWNSSVNAYFNRVIDKNNALTIDAVGTYYGNLQRSISSENGQNAYYDNMLLKNNKYSIIGEALYESNHDAYQFCIGYKFSTAHIRNLLNNSISDGNWEDINTIQHYYYAQLKQSFGPFSYELALAGTSDIRKGLETCRNTTFTPRVITGYRINNDQYVRLKYSSYTIVPDMMQTSQNRILIMNNMYKTGNPDLKIANIHTLDLTYSFNKKGINLESVFFYRNNKHQIYDGYFDKETYLEKKTLNYDKNVEMGMELNLNYDISKYFRADASI